MMLTDITCVRFTTIIFANSWHSLCLQMCTCLVCLDHFELLRECGVFFKCVWNIQWCGVLQISIKTRSVFGDVFAELQADTSSIMKHHAVCGMRLEPDLLLSSSCVLRGSSRVLLAGLAPGSCYLVLSRFCFLLADFFYSS